jgi:hypothetical protein
MAYRFSDTGKWNDEWFVDLSPQEKLLFIYLCDNCDIAGFYEISLRRLSFDTGLTNDEIKVALKGLGKSYILSDDKKVIFIKNFVKHQKNLPLNPDNKAHRGIISRFENYSTRFADDLISMINIEKKVAPWKGLESPQGIGNGIDMGNLKLFTNDEEFFKIFERWILYKKARKEMYKTQDSFETAFKKLLKYSKNNSKIAFDIIESAIGNNYSGFFELSEKEYNPKKQNQVIDYANIGN